MRYLVISLCVFAAACTGAGPSAPTSSLPSAAGTSAPASVGGAMAQGGSALPFKGDLQATEAVDGSQHHLVGAGNGSHLGRFSYMADLTVDDNTGDGVGTVTWTAANGDQIVASTAGRILVADFAHNRITVGETQTIIRGTGRFSSASGTISVERSLDLLTGATAGSFTGTIDMGR